MPWTSFFEHDRVNGLFLFQVAEYEVGKLCTHARRCEHHLLSFIVIGCLVLSFSVFFASFFEWCCGTRARTVLRLETLTKAAHHDVLFLFCLYTACNCTPADMYKSFACAPSWSEGHLSLFKHSCHCNIEKKNLHDVEDCSCDLPKKCWIARQEREQTRHVLAATIHSPHANANKEIGFELHLLPCRLGWPWAGYSPFEGPIFFQIADKREEAWGGQKVWSLHFAQQR